MKGTAKPWYTHTRPNTQYLNSCVAPYPLDANKCHQYTCNESTGQYVMTSTSCGTNELCNEATGACMSTCKTYTGTGTHTIKPCDVIQGDHYTLHVKSISYNMFGKDGSVTFTAQYTNSGKKLEEQIYAPIGDIPKWLNTMPAYNNQQNRLAIHDGFLRIAPPILPANSTKPTATVTVEPNCVSLLNDCLSDLAKNGPFQETATGSAYVNMVQGWNCQLICPASPNIPQQSYVATPDIRLEMPTGYSKAAALAAGTAQNCLSRLVSLFGIPPSHPIYVSYAVSTNAGCSFGADEQYKLSCFVTPQYSDSAIEKLPQYASLVSAVMAGQCSGVFDQFDDIISDKLPHELAHNFAHAAFSAANHEGFATFAANAIDDIGTGSTLKLECAPAGYTFSKSGTSGEGPYTAYTKWNTANYFGGACLLQEYQKLYGSNTLKSAFQIFHQMPMQTTVHFFKDVLNAASQDDFFTKSKNIHLLNNDPTMGSGPTQYFFSTP